MVIINFLVGLLALLVYLVVFLGIIAFVEIVQEMFNEHFYDKYNKWPGFNAAYYVQGVLIVILSIHFIYIIGSFILEHL